MFEIYFALGNPVLIEICIRELGEKGGTERGAIKYER